MWWLARLDSHGHLREAASRAIAALSTAQTPETHSLPETKIPNAAAVTTGAAPTKTAEIDELREADAG
jgi:hypothetical protein